MRLSAAQPDEDAMFRFKEATKYFREIGANAKVSMLERKYGPFTEISSNLKSIVLVDGEH